MRFRALLPLVLAGTIACVPADEPPTPPAPTADGLAADKPEPDFDADNLLNMAYGASVVSRSGELSLEQSAANAIDGIASSAWNSASYSRDDTLVFSFPAPARVTRLGVTTSADASLVPDKLTFEWSADGAEWHSALTMEPTAGVEPQLVDIKPFTGQYVRVRSDETKNMYAVAFSLHAIGREIAAPKPRSPAGCWTVNGVPSFFAGSGARVAGRIESRNPTILEGGTDGRVIRALWIRGPMWGHAVFTMTPDGNHLTGLEIHEQINLQNRGASLFGLRCQENDLQGRTAAPAAKMILDRTGTWPMFGLAFGKDDRLAEEASAETLDMLTALMRAEPSQRFRVTAREQRGDSAEENRRHTDARIASMRGVLQARGADIARIDFVSAGSVWKSPELYVSLQRLLASRVDVQRIQ